MTRATKRLCLVRPAPLEYRSFRKHSPSPLVAFIHDAHGVQSAGGTDPSVAMDGEADYDSIRKAAERCVWRDYADNESSDDTPGGIAGLWNERGLIRDADTVRRLVRDIFNGCDAVLLECFLLRPEWPELLSHAQRVAFTPSTRRYLSQRDEFCFFTDMLLQYDDPRTSAVTYLAQHHMAKLTFEEFFHGVLPYLQWPLRIAVQQFCHARGMSLNTFGARVLAAADKTLFRMRDREAMPDGWRDTSEDDDDYDNDPDVQRKNVRARTFQVLAAVRFRGADDVPLLLQIASMLDAEDWLQAAIRAIRVAKGVTMVEIANILIDRVDSHAPHRIPPIRCFENIRADELAQFPELMASLPPIRVMRILHSSDVVRSLSRASSLAGVDVYLLHTLFYKHRTWSSLVDDRREPTTRGFLKLLHARRAGVYLEEDARRLFGGFVRGGDCYDDNREEGECMRVWFEMREERLKELVAQVCDLAEVRARLWRLGGTLAARRHVRRGEWPASVRLGVPYHPRFAERAHPARLAALFNQKRAEGRADWCVQEVVATGWVDADVHALFDPRELAVQRAAVQQQAPRGEWCSGPWKFDDDTNRTLYGATLRRSSTSDIRDNTIDR